MKGAAWHAGSAQACHASLRTAVYVPYPRYRYPTESTGQSASQAIL